MSRLDKFEEILKSYDGREYKEELSSADIRKILSDGFEDHYRVGLLVGSINERVTSKPGVVVTEKVVSAKHVIVPEQDSDRWDTNVKDWGPAIREAKSKGDIIGMVVYVGKNNPLAAISNVTFENHKTLYQNHGVGDLIMSLNEKECDCKRGRI